MLQMSCHVEASLNVIAVAPALCATEIAFLWWHSGIEAQAMARQQMESFSGVCRFRSVVNVCYLSEGLNDEHDSMLHSPG